MSQIGKLAGQTAIYGLGSILPKLLNFAILTPFYTRVLGKGSYGTVTEIYAYVVIIMVILTFGMETGFFRFCRDEKNIRKVYTHAFAVVLSLSVIWLVMVQVFIDPLSGMLRYEQHPEYIRWFAWIIALDAIASIPFAKLRQENRPVRFAALKLTMVGMNIVLVMIFLWLFPWLHESLSEGLPGWLYDPDIGVGYVFIVNLLTSLLTFLLLIPELRVLHWSFDRELLIKMLRFSSPLVIVGIAGSINDVADKVLLKFLLPDQDTALDTVGIYGAGYRLAVLMTLYVQMFRYAFEPFMFSIFDQKDAKQIYAKVMNYFVILGLLIFLGVTFYMDGIKYFLGNDFHDGIGITPVILLANLMLGIYYNLSVWYKVADRTRYAAVIASVGALITLVMNVALIPKIGFWASAWATLACYTVMMIFSYLWGKAVYPIPYRTSRILGWMVGGLVLFGVSELFKPDQLVWRLLLNTILISIFIGWVVVREKELVSLLLKRIRKGL